MNSRQDIEAEQPGAAGLRPDMRPNAVIALADGTIFEGLGFGARGETQGELCFNTAMTGYQEILSDPSYAGQVVAFTFPHIGITGTNDEDVEAGSCHALGMVAREFPSEASNWRAQKTLHEWMEKQGLIGIAGIDTRALTIAIRRSGSPHIALHHFGAGEERAKGANPDDHASSLLASARGFAGLEGADLAGLVTREEQSDWDEARWELGAGYGRGGSGKTVVVVDFGAKHNISRCLVDAGAKPVIVPASCSAEDILALEPAGVCLSNGPGDPAATGEYSVPMIRAIVEAGIPVFGICLGHQMLALAFGARTVKMPHGHHGANHPVKHIASGKVSITSMNHGFAVDNSSLPPEIEETHISLFDGSNCGIRLRDYPAFSVQFHPEASPGPMDSLYLFEQFMAMLG